MPDDWGSTSVSMALNSHGGVHRAAALFQHILAGPRGIRVGCYHHVLLSHMGFFLGSPVAASGSPVSTGLLVCTAPTSGLSNKKPVARTP